MIYFWIALGIWWIVATFVYLIIAVADGTDERKAVSFGIFWPLIFPLMILQTIFEGFRFLWNTTKGIHF